jgi:aryl-alcohol dehydrogenase-like predicted oxidoreductase
MTFGQQNTQNEGFEQLDRAVAHGVNFIDTAELYPIPPRPDTRGATEIIIGNWLAARNNRNDIVLATKIVGRFDQANWFRPDGAAPRLTKAHIDFAVERSLKALRTDYIDLYQIHWPDRPSNPFGYHSYRDAGIEGMIPFEETLEALSRHVDAGRIRALGLSNETPWGAMRFLHVSEAQNWPRMASIQNVYNAISRRFDYGLAEIAHREDLGLLAYSPLAQGYLSGKYRNGALPEGTRKTLFGRLERYEGAGGQEAIDEFCDLAQSFGVSPASLALKFVHSRSFVTSTIIGATKLEQLNDNLKAFEMEWSDEMDKALHKLHVKYRSPSP